MSKQTSVKIANSNVVIRFTIRVFTSDELSKLYLLRYVDHWFASKYWSAKKGMTHFLGLVTSVNVYQNQESNMEPHKTC